MSISDLMLGLKKVKADLTAKEIAEILWFWVQTTPEKTVEDILSESAESILDSKQAYDNVLSTPTNPNLSNLGERPQIATNSDLYPKIIDKYLESDQDSSIPLQIPDAPAIPNKREIERVLRRLRRKNVSQQEKELNEIKLVNNFAETGLFLPEFKPKLTYRWLSLVLVIEINNSLLIWQQTIAELRQVLKRLRIFHRIDVWGLQVNLYQIKPLFYRLLSKPCSKLSRLEETLTLLIFLLEREGVQVFLYDDLQRKTHRTNAIVNGQKKPIILIASDLVSQNWYYPELYILLSQWSQRGMVNLLQLLPQRLWRQTVLGEQKQIKLKSTSHCSLNHKLISLDPILKNNLKIPIISLEAELLETWSTLVMGIGNNQSLGYEMKLPNDSLPILLTDISPKERVKRFQGVASPTALKLAQYLSATLVTLPVIRVIQYTMLPLSNSSHVAEVLMGGLFKPLERIFTPYSNPDEYEFHFYKGVREELLTHLTVNEIFNNIEQTSLYIAKQMGKSLKEFQALLLSPQTRYHQDTLAQQIYPFARIQAEVLDKLGGQYSQFAQKIYQAQEFQETVSQTIPVTREDEHLSQNSICIDPYYTINFEHEVYTHSLNFGPIKITDLPGPFGLRSDEIVAQVHDNVVEVAKFFQEVLQLSPLDLDLERFTSTVMLTVDVDSYIIEDPQINRINLVNNASSFLGKKQVVFGSTFITGKLLSLGTELTVVAHEFSELIINSTCKLHFKGETGSLAVSYADIFAVLIANRNKNNISKWNWELGRPFGQDGHPIRNFANPTLYGQPDHWSGYDSGHAGAVHYNCGIHNKAAYNLMNATYEYAPNKYLFDSVTLSRLFYHTLCKLSREATFRESGLKLMSTAATIFRKNGSLQNRAETAINQAFADVGITL